MPTVPADLDPERQREAREAVAALAGASAEDVATALATWMEGAYGMTPLAALPAHGDIALRLYERGEGRMLVAALPASTVLTPQHLVAAKALTFEPHADSVIVVSLQPIDTAIVPDEFETGVAVWGPEQLEYVHRRIVREVSAPSI